jgi:hypothetical protein
MHTIHTQIIDIDNHIALINTRINKHTTTSTAHK